MNASAYGRIAIVDLLIARGAEVNATTSAGLSPLAFAVWEGRASVAKRLLAHGAHADVRYPDGRTLLDFATGRGDQELVELLRGFRTRRPLSPTIPHGAK
jgi:ankyrin repeat protein